MLLAKNADHAATHAYAGIHHGDHALLEQRRAKLGRARVAVGVIGVNGALQVERVHVDGIIGDVIFLAASVRILRAAEEIYATQDGAVFVQQPHAGIFHFQNFRGRLGDLDQGIFQVAAFHDLAGGELHQHFVLPAQPPLVLAQSLFRMLALGDVLHRAFEADQVTMFVAHRAGTF